MSLAVFLSDPLSLSAVLCWGFAIISVWLIPLRWIWLLLAGIATGVSYLAGRIDLTGIVSELLFGGACYAFFRPSLQPFTRLVVGSLVVGLSVALGSHKMPGFHNWLVFPELRISENAPTLRYYLNFDKPLVGLFLLGWGVPTLRTLDSGWNVLKKTMPIILWTLLLLLGLSFLLGYVQVDLKWPSYSWIWLLIQLVFTCTTEEVFFRGFLQEQLGLVFGNTKMAWGVASILFGLAHFPGGLPYVLLAGVAGLCYGFSYLHTKRIESSICTHFAVNVIHFFLFTYPKIS